MIWIGVGGMLGAIIRYWLGKEITIRKGTVFPLATWMINISGSFMLGLLAFLYNQEKVPSWLWYFLGIGFLGAYTTFSTFGFEMIQLLEKREYRTAGIYAVTSVLLGVIFAWIGALLADILV